MFKPQPLLFEDDAKSEFAQIEKKVLECIEAAEKEWNKACEASPRIRKSARGRGRNSLFNEIVADFAREKLKDAAEVELCEQYGTVRLHFKEKYDLGFKKVDSKGRSRAYPTPRQKKFQVQLPLWEWADPMPEGIRVTIGIVWNAAATEIADVMFVYPYKRTPLWHYSITNGWGDGAASIKLTPPARPAAPAKFKSTLVKEDKKKKGKRVE